MDAVTFSIGPRAALYSTQLLGLTHTSGHKVLATAGTAPPLAVMGKWAHSPAPWQDPSGLMQHVLPGESSQGILLAPPAFLFPKTASLVCVSSSPFTLVHSLRVPLGFGLGTSMFWVQFLQRHLSFVLVFLCPRSCPQYLSLGNESMLTTAGCQQFSGRQLCNS